MKAFLKIILSMRIRLIELAQVTIICFALFVSFRARGDVQARLYVSPNGTGTNFSQAQPGELFSARNQVRSMTSSMTGDIVVSLYGGMYALTNSFQLQENSTNHDSGTGGYNVIYQAVPGTSPIISGGIVVTNWSLYNAATNIWRAYVGTNINSRQLYVNGVRALRARSTQNPGGFTVTATGFTSAGMAMQTWGNVTNIEIVQRNDWKQLRCCVASVAGSTVIMQTPGWTYTSSSPNPGHPYNGNGTVSMTGVSWVENAYELLTYPGMWYLNRATGYLYYIPRAGENLATATVELPVVEKLVDAGGSLTTPIHNIVFSGIAFEYGTWLLPSTSAGYADNQTSILWSNAVTPLKTTGNVSFQTASNIQLTNDVFAHLGGSAVDFGGGAHGNIISGSQFEDISATGITLGEVTDYATSNTNQMTDGNVIRDNYFRQVGQEYEDAIGIWVGFARNTLISHNDVANAPYTGISVGWGWGTYSYAQNNQVVDNYVGDVMQTLYDGGSFYTLSAQTNSWVSGNYFKDSCLQGIYWDEGTAYYTALSNVVDNCSGNWVNIWTTSIHNNIATNNFSNVHAYNNSGTACVVTNTTYVAGQNWPAAAQAIIQNAGLEPAFTPIQLPTTTFNDNATNCTYHGSWSYDTNLLSADYDADVHVTTNAGDYVDFVFFGTGVSAICRGDTNCGNFDIYLDGVYQTTASANTASQQPQLTLFSTNNLSVQTHTLRLINKGGQSAIVDAFSVQGVPEIIINDNTPVYDHVPNDWSYSSGRNYGDFHSDVHYTQNNGQYVQYTFVGPYIVWISELDPSEGSVGVYLDGVLQTNVNCTSTTRIAQARLFTAMNLSPGRHTLKLVKNSGSYMVVDAFAVAPTPPVPPAPLGLNATGGTNQVSLAWNASPGATGYNLKCATVTGGPYTNIASLGGTNYADSELAAGTSYFYVVTSTNTSGESSNSLEASAITIPASAQGIAPIPIGLTLKLTGFQAALSWTASPGATSYNLKRATISGGPYTIITNFSGTGAADSVPAYGTTYYYVISAVNVFGESGNSAEVSATTPIAAGNAYQTTIIADSPVGYWPLDLTSDTNTDSSGNLLATDLSGHNNTGTYRYITASGNYVAGPTAFLPNAASFDGVTTYVDLSTGSSTALLNISGKLTLEAWVAPASASTYGDIMGKGYDSSLNDDELEMRANSGNYHGGVYTGSGGDQGVTGGTEATNWTHIVCSYDGTNWNLYLNGVKSVSSANTTGAFAFADPWAIGSGTADGLSRGFTGNICQAAIYNYALTSAQVATHYTRARNGQAPAAPTGLLAAPRDGRVSLSWIPCVGATSYNVKYSAVSGGLNTQLASIAGSGYVDSGLTNGTAYYYVVSASNAAGTSANSSETNATPAAMPPIVLSAQTQAGAAFSLSIVTQSNTTFVIENSTNLTDWVAILTNSSPNGEFTFSGSMTNDTPQFYRVYQP
jgi:fibronectin type 3 domain-containing protein